MFNYFRYVKEMRELKKQQLVYTTALLSKLYDFVDAIPDIAELAQKTNGIKGADFQKMVVDELVNWSKSKEEKAE